MPIRSLAPLNLLAGLGLVFSAAQGFAQVTSIDTVGYAGPNANYLGGTTIYHADNVIGPVSGNWSGQTGINDVSSPGIGTVGTLSYNINGGHIGVYEHISTEQTAAATDNGYVSVYTKIGSVDYVTITGLPTDTAVNVNILFAVTGELSGDYGAYLSRAFSVHNGTWGTAARLDFTGVHLANGAFNETFSQTVTMRAGRQYEVGSEVTFSMSGTGATGFSAYSTLDSTHSSNVRFYPQGLGAGVSSFSGFDYTSPVPEPSVTLGAGATLLFALGHFYRRRTRASQA